MPRDARIDVAKQWYHVIARGRRRSSLFFDAHDKRHYLQILSEILQRNQADLAAYCLMTSHVHLLIYRRDRSLGTIFRQAHMMYATYFNQRHRKVGYVFQGRFKSKLIADEHYLLELCYYIHMNPIKAKMCTLIDEYSWSSHHHYKNQNTCFEIPPKPAPAADAVLEFLQTLL